LIRQHNAPASEEQLFPTTGALLLARWIASLVQSLTLPRVRNDETIADLPSGEIKFLIGAHW
jgi:hypothetical protein